MGDLLNDKEVIGIAAAKKSRPTDIFGHQKSVMDLENQVKEMTAKHEEELVALQHALKRHEADLQKKLAEKERECDIMMGRLEESRTARECTLQEFNALSDKYDDMQKCFKQQIAELLKKIESLKEALEKAKNVTVEATAAEVEETEKLKDEVTRLREEKMKMLLDIEQKDRDGRYRERILVSKSAKLVDTQKELDKAKQDMSLMQSELMTLREFRVSWNENQKIVADKSRRIDDLERKVASLNASKDKLKETLIVLDEQLKEFEMTVVEKNEQIERLHQEKKTLESDNLATIGELKAANAELNSVKGIKASMDEKLKKTAFTLEKIETEKDFHVTELQTRLSKLMMTNQELEEQVDTAMSRCEAVEALNEHLNSCIEALRTECRDHRDENAVIVNQYIREKSSNTQSQSEIEEVKLTNENLMARVDAMREDIALLEFEKNEIEIKMKTMLKQQIKLIEYLQSENEILTSKKKKTFVGRILGRDKEKEPFVPPSPKVATLPPTQTKDTANCVLREQNVLRYLESEANKLRLQLNSCKTQEMDKENARERGPATPKAVKSVETQTKLAPSAHNNSELAALAAMDHAVIGEVSTEGDSDLSGYERDLYFAEREKQARLLHGDGCLTETDTDDCS